MEAWQSVLVSLAIVCAFIAATYIGYEKGVLDPLIEQFGAVIFKMKAKAEQQKMQAQGEEFLGSQLKDNKQASEMLDGVGPIGGLKKHM